MSSTQNVDVDRTTRLFWARILWAATALAGGWAFDGFVLHTGLLAPIHGRNAWTPLYAVLEIAWRPQALVFVALAVLLVWLVPQSCAPQRMSSKQFTWMIAFVSAAASFALFLVRQDPGELGALFDHYRDEEFLHDARAIVDPGAFFSRYVELMPQLSTHGRHFPPGNALFLHTLIGVFGDGAIVAGSASLVGVAVGCACAYRAVGVVSDDRRARQAAWMIATAPALLDFGAASMDAVFFAIAALALWLGLRALSADSNSRIVVAAGFALFAATLFSFSSAMLGLVLALYACFRAPTEGRAVIVRFTGLAATALAAAIVLWFVSGFSIFDCAVEALRSGHAFMHAVMARSTHTDRARLLFGNAAAFALLVGVGTIAALTYSVGARTAWRDAWTRATAMTLTLMCATYYLETERIWLFALPWIAVLCVMRNEWDATSLRRLVGVNLVQAWIFEIGFFTLW